MSCWQGIRPDGSHLLSGLVYCYSGLRQHRRLLVTWEEMGRLTLSNDARNLKEAEGAIACQEFRRCKPRLVDVSKPACLIGIFLIHTSDNQRFPVQRDAVQLSICRHLRQGLVIRLGNGPCSACTSSPVQISRRISRSDSSSSVRPRSKYISFEMS